MKVKLYNWEIEITEESRIEIEDKGNKGEWGNIIYADKKITLRKDLPLDLKKQTLVHELTHAIIVYLGYGKLKLENICDFMGAHYKVINEIVEAYFSEKQV